MNFSVTEAAKKRLLELLGDYSRIVRIGLSAGGCSGFTQLIQPNAEEKSNDIKLDVGDFVIIMDPRSAKLLDNYSLDWRGGLMEKRFVLLDGNMSNHACSCGSSLSI